MACPVKVISPDGSITQERALIDCVASTSQTTEHLGQQLRLLRRHCNLKISRVAGIDVHPRGTVTFKFAGIKET